MHTATFSFPSSLDNDPGLAHVRFKIVVNVLTTRLAKGSEECLVQKPLSAAPYCS